MEDHAPVNELENQHGSRYPQGREDPTNRLETFMNPSYSPLRLTHHNPAHYNPNLGANFNANAARQPYHQEHAVYGGYHHPQNYYYQNHYEPHFMQPMHENPIDAYHHHTELLDSHGEDPSLSLMLSNETAKPYKHKVMQQSAGVYGDPNMKKQQQHQYGYQTYEHDNEEDIFYDKKPMIRIQPEMLRNSANLAGKHQLNGINMNPNELELKSTEPKRISGAIRFNSRPDPNPRRLPTEKMESYMEDDDNMDDDMEGKGRSTRGLRILSLKVKEIVTQKKRTSYKEVAESLTYELRSKSTAPRSAKEEVSFWLK